MLREQFVRNRTLNLVANLTGANAWSMFGAAAVDYTTGIVRNPSSWRKRVDLNENIVEMELIYVFLPRRVVLQSEKSVLNVT